jgi:hypothetical protein
MRMEAKYKDYNPIEFDVGVKYLPSLGSHVFFKNIYDRPQSPYKFELANVLQDGVDDDYDNYEFKLHDGLEDYYDMEDRDNIIMIPLQDSHTFPKVGENVAKVAAIDGVFQDSSTEFFTLPA